MFNTYLVRFKLINEVLGASPKSPSVYKQFLVDKHNELAEKYKDKISKNPSICKYSKQPKIEGTDDIEGIFRSIERELQRSLSKEERENLLSDNSEDFILELLGETTELKTQIFQRDAERLPYLGSQVVKGFLKSASEAISRTRPSKNGKFNSSIAASSKYINTMMISTPIYFFDEEGKRVDIKRLDDGSADLLERPLRCQTAKGDRVALASSEVIEEGSYGSFAISLFGGDSCPVKIKDLKDCLNYGVIQGLSAWRGSGSKGTFQLLEIKEVKNKKEIAFLNTDKLMTLPD